jgi:hypothetical protein
MASLLDAFNAGARVTSQALDMFTREKQYEQNIGLFDASVDLESRKNKIAQARETVYDDSGINYRQNPDYPKTFQEYTAKLMTEWQNTWSQKYPNSKFFTNNLHEIQEKGNIAIQQAVLSAEAKYASQKVNSTYDAEINKIWNNPEWDTDRKLAESRQITDYTRGAAGWDLNTYDQRTKNYLAMDLKERLQFTPGDNITAGDIRNKYKALMDEGLKPGDQAAGEESGLYAAFPGAKDAIETARDGAVSSQWAYNFKGLNSLDTAYDAARQDYENAVRGGDPERVQAAYINMMTLYRRGKPEQDAALGDKSSEYNPDNIPQIMRMFPDPPEFSSRDKKLSKAETDRFTEHLVQLVFDQFYGDARDEYGNSLTLTIPEAYIALGNFLKSAGENIPEREYKEWFDDIFTRRIESEPGTNPASGFLKTLLNNPLALGTPEAEKMTGYKGDDEREYQKQAVDTLNAEYQNRVLNLVAKNGLLPGNQKFLVESIEELKKTYIGELSVIMDSNLKLGSASTVEDTGNYKGMAQAIEWIEKTPSAQIEDRKGGSPYSSVNNDSIMAYKQMASDYLESALKSKGIVLTDTNQDGRIVSGHDNKGNAYRIRGAEKNMPKTGGGEIKQTVLLIETKEKGKDEWAELEELTKAQLGTVESMQEAARKFNQPGPVTTPAYDPVTGNRKPGAYVSPDKWRR